VPAQKTGATFTVDVRVNTGGKVLGAFNVMVAYEEQNVEFVSAEKAKVAGTMTFEQGVSKGKADLETTCSKAGLGKTCVTAAGTIDKSSTRNTVVLFRIKFKVKSAASKTSKLSGVVVELLDAASKQIGAQKNTVFAAGKLEFVVSNGQRRTRRLADNGNAVAAARPRRNTIAKSLPSLKGNANCDDKGEFSLADPVFVLNYIAEAGAGFTSTQGKEIKSTVTACQNKNKLTSADVSFMDADSNSVVNTGDLTFLLGVLVGNFAFVDVKPVAPTKTACAYTINTYVATAGGGEPPAAMRLFLDFALDASNSAHSKLQAQLEKLSGFVTKNKGTSKLSGALVEIKAASTAPQVFGLTLDPPLKFDGVGLSVIQVSSEDLSKQNKLSWKFFGGKPTQGFSTSAYKGHLKYGKGDVGAPGDVEQENGYNPLVSLQNNDTSCVETTTTPGPATSTPATTTSAVNTTAATTPAAETTTVSVDVSTTSFGPSGSVNTTEGSTNSTVVSTTGTATSVTETESPAIRTTTRGGGAFSVVLTFNLDFGAFDRLILGAAITDALVAHGISLAEVVLPIMWFQGSVNGLVAVNTKATQDSIVAQKDSITNHALSGYMMKTGGANTNNTSTTVAATTANATQVVGGTDEPGGSGATSATDSSKSWVVPLILACVLILVICVLAAVAQVRNQRDTGELDGEGTIYFNGFASRELDSIWGIDTEGTKPNFNVDLDSFGFPFATMAQPPKDTAGAGDVDFEGLLERDLVNKGEAQIFRMQDLSVGNDAFVDDWDQSMGYTDKGFAASKPVVDNLTHDPRDAERKFVTETRL